MKRNLLLALSTLGAFVSIPACSSEAVEPSARQSAAATIGEGDLATNGILREESFCPRALIPRKDMARYLGRMKHGRDFIPEPSRNTFADVPADTEEAAWIEQLAADGVTRGTGPGMFSPNDTVPREQMAAFIVRLRGSDVPAGGQSRFTDVTNPDFIGAIEQLANDGITKGCTATEFCPNEMVPRDQMAAFLMRALHPGSADPQSSGRFADVPNDNMLAGRVEQAVSEGIMEPCATYVSRKPLVVGLWPNFMSAVDHPAPTLESVTGWLHTTPNYGLLVHSRNKHYMTGWHATACGGDYNATVVLDIGEVTHDGVYLRGATFYTQGVSPIVHQDYIWAGTNGHLEKFNNYSIGLTDIGTPYLSFKVEKFFPGGQGRNGDALQIGHTMIPDSNSVPLVEYIPSPSAGWKAAISSVLSDNPDGGNCAMIMRLAHSTY